MSNHAVESPSPNECRHFVTYSGISLPLNLVTPLEPEALRNRNTYFRAWFDAYTRICFCEKITYGEVELSHRYEYHDNGQLKYAVIVNADDERTTMSFNEQGALLDTLCETP